MRRYLIPSFLLIGLLAGCSPAADGETLRNVTFESIDGETIDLTDHIGKPVVLNFWATWCAPCRVEMPILQTYYDQHPGEFDFYAINVGESQEIAQAYLTEAGYTFPAGLDPENRLADQLAVRGLPVTLIYDTDGNLYYRHTGGISADVLEEQLTPLLEH